MVDSHCHLADDAFVADWSAVVNRARAAGIEQALCILEGGNAQEESRAVTVCSAWDGVHTAVGVHPHIAGRFAEAGETGLEQPPGDLEGLIEGQLQRLPRAVAIGEIGLDYHYDLAPRPVQRDLFARQVALAVRRRLPVVIHSREADQDTVDILTGSGRGEVRGVIHCFTGDAAFARQCLDLGFFISFSGIVTFRPAESLREVARSVPDARILVETDAPYLAPVPHRGKRNEPAWVCEVLQRVAEVRGTAPDELGRQVTENFRALFAV